MLVKVHHNPLKLSSVIINESMTFVRSADRRIKLIGTTTMYVEELRTIADYEAHD